MTRFLLSLSMCPIGGTLICRPRRSSNKVANQGQSARGHLRRCVSPPSAQKRPQPWRSPPEVIEQPLHNMCVKIAGAAQRRPPLVFGAVRVAPGERRHFCPRGLALPMLSWADGLATNAREPLNNSLGGRR
jgi:hypothetical protein